MTTGRLASALTLCISLIGPGALAESGTLPNAVTTPGAIDPHVNDHNICRHDWQKGAPPKLGGGTLTYSQAARATSAHVKDMAFESYGLENPHDGGQSYEVDHRVPLSLGGLDVLENLWPESRTAEHWNAWVKDRLEFKLYNLICHHTADDPNITVKQAQEAFLGDWTDAYMTYCPDEEVCPSYDGGP